MMKNTKKNKKKKTKILLIVIAIIIILLLFIFMLYKALNINKKVYTKVDRTKQLQAAKEKSPDIVGWLTIYDANIDIPIITKKKASDMTVKDIGISDYAWIINDNNKFANKVGITGHNIINLSSNPIIDDKSFSRLENLMSFVYLDYAKSHQYLQYTVDGTTHYYKMFAVFFSSGERNFGTIKLTNNQMKEVLDKYKELSIYDYDVDLKDTDNIIIVATCTRFFGINSYDKTFLIVGRELRKNEKKMVEYNVVANDNYKIVEEKMKGSENNE